jgi:hypothetical protein
MKKKERRRVDRERVKSNAAEGSGGGLRWLRLPKGVDSYQPEKPGGVRLDIIPYEVKSPNHPDRVEPGTIWYKRPFAVHFSVGVNAEEVVCPVLFGKRCPMCEERARLAKNWDENEEAVKALTPQKWVAYNIVDPDDSDGVRVFVFSRGKFAEFLENELLEGDESNLSFYDVTEDGRTLKVRFSEDTYQGRKFIKATRIDFVQRSAMDEDDILSKTVCLDEAFTVLTYDQLETMFNGQEDSDSDADESDDKLIEVLDEEEQEQEVKPQKKPVQGPSKKVEKVEPEEDLDFDDDDEEEEEEEVKPQKKSSPKKVELTEDDDDDDEFDLPPPVPPKKKGQKGS